VSRSLYRHKAAHTLYSAASPEEFCRRFAEQTGAEPWWHPSIMLPGGRLKGLVLGGSIPLGIGSAASDIDLIAVLDLPESVPQGFPARDGVVSTTYSGVGTPKAFANLVLIDGAVEIDIVFLALERLEEMHRLARRPAGPLNPSDLRLLSMSKHGWVLQDSPNFAAFLEMLRNDHVLVMKATVSKFIFALKALEDARAAVADNAVLALHLGRSCVDWTVQGYYASQGILHLGEKWLRLASAPRLAGINQIPAGLLSRAQHLLFPAFSQDRTEAARYLHDVARFAADVKAFIERNPRLKAAFALSAQVGDPLDVCAGDPDDP
jgi:hypothetical protein